jgi:hypothetical protein
MLYCSTCRTPLLEGAVLCPCCGFHVTPPPLQQEGSNLSFSGTYLLDAHGVTVTLLLQQDAHGNIAGKLSSTHGSPFQIQGRIENAIAIGTCSDDASRLGFEARLYSNQLSFALIEPPVNNVLAPHSVREYCFTRYIDSAPSNNISDPASGAFPSEANEIEAPHWGFKFQPPAGWKSQQGDRVIILGHAFIAGLILILPHLAPNNQDVRQQMVAGMAEEGMSLSLVETLQSFDNNGVVGNYEGLYNGQQIKARCIGTVSPYGGGTYILALSTPERFSSELSSAAETIAQRMRYVKVEVSDLLQHFAGTWGSVSSNRITRITLTPHGDYYETYEAAFSGQFHNQFGDQTGTWGTARQDQNRGRWTIQGNKAQGHIIITVQNTRQHVIAYCVHVERGRTFWQEYWLNGELYSKQRAN